MVSILNSHLQTMKIFLRFLLFLLFLLAVAFTWFYWEITRGSQETIVADLDTKTLFDTRCGICHNGGSPEAPLVAALKLMPEERILAAMTTGVMKNQAMMLTEEQHRALAAYISEVDAAAVVNEVVKGLCADEEIEEMTAATPNIDGWGIGHENQRQIKCCGSANACREHRATVSSTPETQLIGRSNYSSIAPPRPVLSPHN